MLTRQLQESWRNLRTRYVLEKLIFEVTDASVVQEANSKYVVSDKVTYVCYVWYNKMQLQSLFIKARHTSIKPLS